jgi:hypothetical protein
MIELLSFTKESSSAGRALAWRPAWRQAGWLTDDWPGPVPIALPSMVQAECRCRIAGAGPIVGR